jgi:dihydrofolate reductase
MGRLILTTAMTVDALVDVSDWFVLEGGHDAASRELFDGSAGMVLGRKTYEGLAGFWPAQTGEWADLLNPMPKYVASRTLSGPLEWNATLIEGDAVEGLTRLKEELDGHLVLSGCGELARDLLEHGVIDELHFGIHPALGGAGTRPLEGLGGTTRLQLVDVTSFDSGVTRARYVPKR